MKVILPTPKKPKKKISEQLILRIIIIAAASCVGLYAIFTILPEAAGPNTFVTKSEESDTKDENNKTIQDDQAYETEEPEPSVTPTEETDTGYITADGMTGKIKDKDGNAVIEYTVPVGYKVMPLQNKFCIIPKNLNVEADGNTPITFSWSKVDYLEELMQKGFVDLKTKYADTGSSEWKMTLIDSYVTKNINGNDVPVLLTKETYSYNVTDESAPDGYDMINILIATEDSDKNIIKAEIDSYSYESNYINARFPDITTLSKAMIKPAS